MATYNSEELMEILETGELVLPVSYQLEKPINVKNQKEPITEVSISRPPRAGDLQDLPVQNQKFGDFFRPVGKIIGQPVSVISDMDFEDLKVLMGVVSYFLGDSQKKAENAIQ